MKDLTEKNVLAKILNVSAESQSINWEAVNNRWNNQIDNVTDYGLPAFEFANGLILFPHGVCPQFFENRDKIDIAHQTSSTAKITAIEETRKTHLYAQIHILDMAWQSMDNFGGNAVPAKYQELIPDAITVVKTIKTELRRLNAKYLDVHINWDSLYPVCIRQLDSCGYPLDTKSIDIDKTLACWGQLPNNIGTQKTWQYVAEASD